LYSQFYITEIDINKMFDVKQLRVVCEKLSFHCFVMNWLEIPYYLYES